MLDFKVKIFKCCDILLLINCKIKLISQVVILWRFFKQKYHNLILIQPNTLEKFT